MEWLEQWNNALDYLEEHLTGELDIAKAAQTACCSVFHFQRMFSYLAGVPLSEYLRRRRMTAAAFDLQNGDKVLDTALRYGYDSPTSFNRAFRSVHGIAPSAAQREGAPLRAYPRISFKITIKGEAEMEYRIVKKDAFRIVGHGVALPKALDESFAMVPEFWNKTMSDPATIPCLCALMDSEPQGILGVSACMNSLEEWRYYVAVSSSQAVPEGMEEAHIPACTWAVFSGQGAMPLAIQELEKRAVTEWLPTSGYEYGDAPDIEVYLNADPANASFEVWLPIVKKGS